jgi:enoyl-CoA hydratase/carnithine racemase
MASTEFYDVERKGNVFIIKLKHGPENRLNNALLRAYIHTLEEIKGILGPNVEGALITTGSGRFFCNGIDLEEAKRDGGVTANFVPVDVTQSVLIVT